MATFQDPLLSPPSVLDDLGEEVTGIIAPVSLCMAITVLLVRLLNPDGSGSNSGAVMIASLAYDEDSSDSSTTKFQGAILNAVIFAAIMAGMTFGLVLLFKYGCFKIIYTYMAFAVFDIFFLITAIVVLQVLQVLDIHVDAVSFVFGLFNFAIVGTVGVLFVPIPLLAKQGYMVWTGVITAYLFTWVPEWTSWVLIVVMALYDIAAVLIPGGPLNMLVKIAIERQQMLPALVYEARPTRGAYQPNAMRSRRRDGGPGDDGEGGGLSGVQQGLNPGLHSSASMYDSPSGGGTNTPSTAGAYVPPETLSDGQVTPARGVVGARGETATGNGRPASPRISMAPGAAPLLQGGSAQVVPLPGARPGTGGGSTSRPSSFSSASGGGGGRKGGATQSGEGQELMTASRFSGGGPSATGGVAGGRTGPGEGGGKAAGGVSGGGQPLGEGTEADQAWKLLPSADSSSPRALLQSGLPSSSLPPLNPRPASNSTLGPLAVSPTLGPLAAHAHQPGTPAGDAYMPLPPASPAGAPLAAAAGPGAPLHNPPPAQPALADIDDDTSAYYHPRAPDPGPGTGPRDYEEVELTIPDSIKLGLGDFIFYSMLVGRAAMYDFMTVFASYLGIIAGLGITLMCLAFYQRALPALPFSIALGVLFYFLTRLLLEPFLVPLVTTLTFF